MEKHARGVGRQLLVSILLAQAVLVQPLHTGVGTTSAATPDSFVPYDGASLGNLRTRIIEQLGVAAWHEAGYRGRGVKIAVLDTGFQGYRQHLGRCLPAAVTVHSFRHDGNLEARDSQHGILCAEVVHTLAPDAELLLANWEPDEPDSFLAAVRWAREQGARAISCSVIMPTWSDCEGHGNVHLGLTRLLGTGDETGDPLCFASAGNTAERHWCGTFQDDGHGRHEWTPGDTDNVVKPWGTEGVSIEACWRPGACYEVSVQDAVSDHEIARSVPCLGADRCCAVAQFQPQEGRVYRVRLRLVRGVPGSFHLVALGGGLAYTTRRGSIAFPADGPEVIAVGSVNQNGRRSAYSSCGPNSEAPKPDFVATVPFPSAWRARPFAGTSAAAPQAAALAALLWCRHPDWSAHQVRDTLRDAVRRLGSGEHDCETGYGCIQLP
jgi:subtilisin family serine protease